MKKITFLAIAAIVSTAAFSQVKWGVQATGNLSSIGLDAEYASLFKKSSVVGFGAGVVSEASLGKSLALRTSLNLLQKGGKIKSAFDSEDGGGDGSFFPSVSVENKLYYAELPVNLVYNVNTAKGNFYFGAGPSFGMGLFGKTKVTSVNPFDPSEKETEEFDAFKKEEDNGAGFKRFEFSANAIAGYQWKNGLYVNAGYLLGLNNLVDAGEEDGQTYKNRGLQLTVGMFLSKKK
jgi:hypothetical protein